MILRTRHAWRRCGTHKSHPTTHPASQPTHPSTHSPTHTRSHSSIILRVSLQLHGYGGLYANPDRTAAAAASSPSPAFAPASASASFPCPRRWRATATATAAATIAPHDAAANAHAALAAVWRCHQQVTKAQETARLGCAQQPGYGHAQAASAAVSNFHTGSEQRTGEGTTGETNSKESSWTNS